MKFISSLDFVVIREPGHSGLEKLDIDGLESEGFSMQETLEFNESNFTEFKLGPLYSRYSSIIYPSLLVFGK
jgi:hypothetical protein